MISVVIPAYRNAPYLALALESLRRSDRGKGGEAIVVVDGSSGEYDALREQFREEKWVRWLVFDRHVGFAYALNAGVEAARGDKVLLANEDNVFPRDLFILDMIRTERVVWTVQQIEPFPSTLGHITTDLGRDLSTWAGFEAFDAVVENISTEVLWAPVGGYVFPFLMSRDLFLGMGGFDTTYPTPFVSDVDFVYRLQTYTDVTFRKTAATAMYHFVSKSTKRRDDKRYIGGEEAGMMKFSHKWGGYPRRKSDNSITLIFQGAKA